jgi:hypothetical protein
MAALPGTTVIKWKQTKEIQRDTARILLIMLGRWIAWSWLCLAVIGGLAIYAMARLDPARVPFVMNILQTTGLMLTSGLIVFNLLSFLNPTVYYITATGLKRIGSKIQVYRWEDIQAFRISVNPYHPGLRTLEFKVKPRERWRGWNFSPMEISEETIRKVMQEHVYEIAD